MDDKLEMIKAQVLSEISELMDQMMGTALSEKMGPKPMDGMPGQDPDAKSEGQEGQDPQGSEDEDPEDLKRLQDLYENMKG